MSRIILKLSGEALAGELDGKSLRNEKGALKLYDESVIAGIAAQVRELRDAGHHVESLAIIESADPDKGIVFRGE